MTLSYGMKFTSSRFDYQSELPEEYNAGNRCYGRDVAEFIASSMTAQGLRAAFHDEDWGWLVSSPKGADPEFDIAIYNMADETGRATSEWGLWVHCFERRKLLGLLPKRTEVAVPSTVVAALTASVLSAGAEPGAWPDPPH